MNKRLMSIIMIDFAGLIETSIERAEMTTIQYNKDRLDYLLTLFGMSNEELLSSLNDGRKKPILLENIYGEKIKVSLLKRIDEIFHKGLSFYLDFTPLPIEQKTKVFFRKSRFQSVLTMEDKRLVDSFESLKGLLDGYRILTETLSSEYPLHRSFTIEHNPKNVATQVRNILIPRKNIQEHRQFLKAMIANLAEINVYVFEFVLDMFCAATDTKCLTPQSYRNMTRLQSIAIATQNMSSTNSATTNMQMSQRHLRRHLARR